MAEKMDEETKNRVFFREDKWIKTNLNYYIKVRLTDYGIKLYQASFTKYSLPLPKINYDENGYVKFQMHVFMNIFGESLSCGSKMPCYPDIKIQYFKEDQTE